MKALEVKLFNGWLGKTLAQVLGKPKSLRFRSAPGHRGRDDHQGPFHGPLFFALSVELARLLGIKRLSGVSVHRMGTGFAV